MTVVADHVHGVMLVLQAAATAYAERKVLLKQRQAELNAQARFLAGVCVGPGACTAQPAPCSPPQAPPAVHNGHKQ